MEMSGNSGGLSEAQEIQLKTKQVTSQSAASTGRMARMCEETKELGIDTLIKLGHQGEQLDSVEKGMINIHEDMNEAQSNLSKMGSGFGGFFKMGKSKNSKNSKKDDAVFKGESSSKGKAGEKLPEREFDMTGVPTYGGFIAKHTNDEAEVQMEKDMDDVSNALGTMRQLAIDMQCEVVGQNDQLGRINVMAEKNEVTIGAASKKTQKLVNN